ncbi:hypothetical protein CWE08_01050 [Aliidiomarina iranensis]|uniref:Phytoene synthase n=1 Tax=Aliidiomarina iranensis TaxID=1434071 RepID=A0A432W233_9GAMM|nr:phytoene/squalene synthase family protein [Aliidiomarina iranensis]RUO23271.1 hypothetical protein CWE08_01050 [Aliidiomarina iranensis]
MDIQLDLSAQLDTLKKHGKSFYLAGIFLNREELRRATGLYAFLRDIDDRIDEAPTDVAAAEQLASIRANILKSQTTKQSAEKSSGPKSTVSKSTVSKSTVSKSTISKGVLNTSNETNSEEVDKAEPKNVEAKFTVAASSITEFLRGMAYDVGEVAIENEAELLDYCYCVAGTVGEMMCQALYCDDPRAIRHANDLGIGMQLTNIARDVYEDASMNRRYIPREWLNAAPSEIVAADEVLAEQVRDAILHLLELADGYYRSAYAGIALLPFRSRLAILTAGRLYQGIGRSIYAEQAMQWRQRKMLSRLRKFTLCAASCGEFLLKPSLWRYQPHPSYGKPASVLNLTGR